MGHGRNKADRDVKLGGSPADSANRTLPLGMAQRGYRGSIEAIAVEADHNGVAASEIERRLLELGFVEGATVEVLHEGPVGRDPIAVRVNNTTIALRRREAMAVFVTSIFLAA
ncbi:MAG: ferrous iron transport protein A [Bradyrhizobiaceae bacterium]|nr:MAG: ferrous iron transport protein A [Bradyrhizobiaceae bacterium]